jgi:hypothetical protein
VAKLWVAAAFSGKSSFKGRDFCPTARVPVIPFLTLAFLLTLALQDNFCSTKV